MDILPLKFTIEIPIWTVFLLFLWPFSIAIPEGYDILPSNHLAQVTAGGQSNSATFFERMPGSVGELGIVASSEIKTSSLPKIGSGRFVPENYG